MDIIKLYTAAFMYQFYKDLLPKSFNDFFTPVFNRHRYTQFASKSTFCPPLARTNYDIYDIFNIRFSDPKLWNCIEESGVKSSSIVSFKRKYKQLHILAS